MNTDMPTLEAIRTRYSVRRFTAEPVTPEQIDMLLEAAFCAPSACNARPWEIIVVQERAVLDELSDIGRYMKMMAEAPLAIVVCGSEKRMPNHDLLVNDCSAAAQNILLAAHACGLGACWCGIAQKTTIKQAKTLFELPEHICPVAVIAVGRPAEHREQPDRLNRKRVHYDRFGQAPNEAADGEDNTQ